MAYCVENVTQFVLTWSNTVALLFGACSSQLALPVGPCGHAQVDGVRAGGQATVTECVQLGDPVPYRYDTPGQGWN